MSPRSPLISLPLSGTSAPRRRVPLWLVRGLRSFRVQTALVFGGLAAMLCAVLALTLGNMLAREIRDDTARSLDSIARSAALTLSNGLADRLRETRVLARSSELWSAGLGSPAAMQALARSQAIQPHSTWIGVADLEGRVRASTGGLLLDQNVAQRPWFQAGLRGPYVGDVHRALLLEKMLPPTASGDPIRFVDFAAPIEVDGRIVGVLGVHGTWEWSREVVTALMPSDAAARELGVYIFDRAGHPLYEPQGAPRLDARSAVALPKGDASAGAGDAAGRPPTSATVTKWPDGQDYLTSVTALPARVAEADMGWKIVAREPVSIAFARARATAQEAFAIGLVVAGISAALAWFAAGFISRPLVLIARAARDVENGVPGARIPLLGGNDELLQLSEALGGMTSRLHTTIQTAPVGICQVDFDGYLLTTNRRLCEILGIASDLLLQRPLVDLIVRQDQAGANADLQRLRSGEIETLSQELRLVRSQGADVFAAMSASMVRHSDESTPYFIVVVEDITMRKEGEAAERANAAKTAFISQVSHELRTPLNAVLGFSQLMQMDRRDCLSEQQLLRVKAISGAGGHLLAMINDLLDLSQIESGRLVLSPEVVAIPLVLEQSLALVAESARGAGVALQVVPPADERYGFVNADHVRLRQVLMNLLSNAIKYNRTGGNVVVSWGAAKAAAGMIELDVTDSGRGLDAERLTRLFEPFNRLGAESTAIQGTGIGLVITRKLVEMMGGSIAVTSTPGVGSRFSVSLPIGAANAGVPARASDFGVLQEEAPGVRTVLYVEDNEVNVELIKAALKLRTNCRLLIARSGQEALAMVDRVRPDLFLLDMYLGDMTGMELAGHLSRMPQFSQTPFIALSADASPTAIDEAMESGFKAYLTKPVDLRKLVDCLEAA